MRVLIKSATIIDPKSTHHLKTVDLLIENGKIIRIGNSIEESADHVFDQPNQYISQGWVDIGCHIGEPGEEQHETINSACAVGLQGGFTHLAPFSNASRPFQTKSDIQAIPNTFPKIHPIGALTENLEGDHICEYLDMHQHGVSAFSDGLNHISKSGTLMRALQYASINGDYVIHCPGLEDVHGAGLIHEGAVSAAHGMVGFPEFAESNTLGRDLQLVEYTNGKLMSHLITSAEAVERLRSGKESNESIRASVSGLHLSCTVEHTGNFNNAFKVLPVLRSEDDRNALISGIGDGTIGIISSNHVPKCNEDKDLEFPQSAFGSTGLATVFGASRQATKEVVKLETLIACFTSGPREILNLTSPVIEEGSNADLTIFDPDVQWRVERKHSPSKSSNEALNNSNLVGRATGVILGEKVKKVTW